MTEFPFQARSKDVFIWLKYRDLTKKAIHQLKYRFVTDLARELTLLALRKQPQEAKRFKKELKGYSITPIPLHWQRKNWRGFNQAANLAKILAEQLDLTFKDNLLKRARKTEIQANLSREARQLNLNQAFTVSKEAVIKDQKIIVFDDVFTTGTTLREAGKILKKAGASKVLLMALAG